MSKKEVKDIKSLDELELHESIKVKAINTEYIVTRVPGGFLYLSIGATGKSCTFVKEINGRKLHD